MASRDFDLFVIGAGSGGVRASRMSAGYGARVAVAEPAALGGTCVNVGCIPKKLLVYASAFQEEREDAAGFGWSAPEPSHDWATLIANKDKEIARLNGIYGRILDQAGVTTLRGRARISGPHEVEVDGKRYGAQHILVATGGWPFMPEIPGIEHAISSNEAFHLPKLPERVLIVGGGYIAVEFAGIFHGLGAQVTQLYHRDLFLRGFDDDVRTTLAAELRKTGIDLRMEAAPARIERDSAGALHVTLRDGVKLEADAVMYATGRLSRTRDLGLEALGVKLGVRGEIVVDEYSQSSVPGVHAIGDVTDRIALTPVALHEAMCLSATLFKGTPTQPDHRNVPACVFSQPPVGAVGLTEAQARERFGEVDIYRSRFKELKHTLSGRDQQAMMKLVVDPKSDRVLGAHMVGSYAGEIIQGIAVALRCGATKAQFDATLGIHPTSAEEFVTMRERVRA